MDLTGYSDTEIPSPEAAINVKKEREAALSLRKYINNPSLTCITTNYKGEEVRKDDKLVSINLLNKKIFLRF